MKLKNGIAVFIWVLNAGLIIYAGLNKSDTASVMVIDSQGNASALDSVLPKGESGVLAQTVTRRGKINGDSDPTSLEKEMKGDRKEKRSCIDINSADTKELQKIKGIGPVLASRIVQYRSVNGIFGNKEELMKVKGIGPVKMKMISEQVCF
ncbi:MAG: ComEA family DNA-binding protein [Chitinispirillaceae bacterium]